MTDQAPAKLSYANVPMEAAGQGGSLAPKNLGDVVAFASVMARAGAAIPAHLRGDDGACLAVTMLALHWEMNPFMIAAKSYKVGDLIAYEAQVIAAVINTRAPLRTRPTYQYQGEGPELTCTVTGIFKDGTVQTYTSPRLGDIRTKNSPQWKDDPQQQLGYYSIRAWGRRYCPEVIMGVYDRDEADAMRDVTPPARSPDLRARLNANREPSTEGFTVENGEHVSAHLDEILDGDNFPVANVEAETDKPKRTRRTRAEMEAARAAEAEAIARETLSGPQPAADEPDEESPQSAMDASTETAMDGGGSDADMSADIEADTNYGEDLISDYETKPSPDMSADMTRAINPDELAFITTCGAASTMKEVQNALSYLRQTETWVNLTADEQRAHQKTAWAALDALHAADKTVPTIEHSMWRFSNWLSAGAPGGQIEERYLALQKSEMYGRATKDQRDALHAATMGAMGK